MFCPKCSARTRVITTCRDFSDHVRRYRRCPACDHNFVTSQAFEQIIPTATMRPLQVFSEDDVRKMRDMFFDEGKSSKEVAEIFGCSTAWASKIVNGKAWVNV